MRPAAFVIAALFLPASVAAQEAPIKVGDQVRFWTQQRRTVTSGTITEWAVDSFTVSDTWIPIDRGRTTHAGNPTQEEAAEGSSMLVSLVRAGAVGAVGGGMVGFLVGGAMNFDEGVESNAPLAEPATDHPCFEKNCAQIGAAIGAAAGFVLGVLFDAALAKRRPTSGQANVAVAPLHDGRLGVGASVRF